MTALLNLLQVEAVRQGTKGYKPKNSRPYTDLTAAATAKLDNQFSDHAGYVAQLWQDHGAADLVSRWFVVEQSNFDLNLIRPGRAFPAAALQNIHVAIMPCGETWEGVSPLAITKLQPWAEAANCLVFKSPSDLGQGFHQMPCQAVGDNIITIASSTTGSETAGMPPVDLYFPVDWNSYVQPSVLAAGVLAFVDWIVRNATWQPEIARLLLLSTAQADSKGRKILNASAALAQAKLYYGSPTPLPPPPPVPPQNPLPIDVPPVVTPPPVPTPPPAPVPVPPPAPTPSAAIPVISRFDHGVSSSWSGPGANATTFFITTSGATKVTLVDPKGIHKDVTGRTQVQATGGYTAGNTWTLIAENASGSVSKTEVSVHGCLSASDLAN